MEEYIGIIVMNQEDKILLYKNNYYIKIKLENEKELDRTISKKLDEVVNQCVFRFVKKYNKILKNTENNMKMYVVEVSVFNNDLEFIEKEELLKKTYNIEANRFVEKLVRYEKYNRLVSVVFMNIIWIASIMLTLGILPTLENRSFDFEVSLITFIAILVGIGVFIDRYIIGTISIYLTKFYISDKIIKIFDYAGLGIMIVFLTINFINR